MAEEILVKEALTPEMIRAGASLIEALDREHFGIDAVFWMYLSEKNRWRLHLTMPNAYADLRENFGRVFRVFEKANIEGITILDLHILDTKDPLIRTMKRELRRAVPPIRLGRGRLGRESIDDVLIYRVAA